MKLICLKLAIKLTLKFSAYYSSMFVVDFELLTFNFKLFPCSVFPEYPFIYHPNMESRRNEN